jgi:hypothetical protein
MDINRILAELRAERDRLEQAISAIEAVSSSGHRRDRPPMAAARKARRRGRMSAAARKKWKKMSRLMKQRWAQGKMKPKAKST